MAQTTTTAKKALRDIRFFEDEGREVVGVRIEGRNYEIQFASRDKVDIDPADLVNMGE